MNVKLPTALNESIATSNDTHIRANTRESGMRIKPIAIVLPQFHPIKENNEWWGEGFTDWVNVVKGRPLYKGHYQPHLPKHLGYYDLRLAETREAQASLARSFGIYGFCYYHYWFNGRRILEQPVDAILDSGKPNFPFMLCWANENWARNWDGGFDQVLLKQEYSVEDFRDHARHLVRYFLDPRYIRIGERPVFAIYKDGIIPCLKDGVSAFRKELLKNNINVFLIRFERWVGTIEDAEVAYSIFDAGAEFQPLTRSFRNISKRYRHRFPRVLRPSSHIRWIKRRLGIPARAEDVVFDYEAVVDNDLQSDFQNGNPIFPGLCPGWDNSVRRPNGGATILHGSTPEIFERWAVGKIQATDWNLLPEKFLFVNAWNEWAEGNHLEPCERWGTAYLEALQRAVARYQSESK